MRELVKCAFLRLVLPTIALAGVSCQHLPAEADGGRPGEVPPPEVSGSAEAGTYDVRRRVRNATRFLEQDKLEAARREIAPLVQEGVLPQEVESLMAEIEHRRSLMAGRLTPASSERVALQEVNAGLTLPETYGRTVTIPPTDRDIELPSGPMEELVNSPVSMDFEDADVTEIIETLSRIENMNIIADQALMQQGEVPEEAAGLGAPGPDEGAAGDLPTLTVKVQDVPLREILSYISRNMGIAFHVGRNVIWVTQSDGERDNAPKLYTRIYKLRRGLIPGPTGGGGGGGGGGLGASAGGGDEYTDLDLEDALSYVLVDAEDPFRLFPKRNLLIARGTLEQLRRAEEILRSFDIRPKQVLIEARFVTISHADLMRLSFDWGTVGVTNPDGSGTTLHSATVAPNIALGPEASQSTAFSGSGSALNLAGVLGEVDFNLMIEAMQRTQSFRTLSAPRVTVINNHEAEIKKGYTLRYWEEWEAIEVDIDVDNDGEGGGDGVNINDPFYYEPVGSPQSENIGLSLKVKVNIGHDSETVFLSLTPASTQLDGFFNYGTGGDPTELLEGDNNNNNDDVVRRSYQLPKVTENSLATTVVAKSGQTVVLGGMIETRVINQVRKVPFIGDIPLLGRFFRSDEDVNEPEHLLVFVTPRVINENGEFVRVNQDSEPFPGN